MTEIISTAAAIERSQAFLGAVLGADEAGNLPENPRVVIGDNNPPEPIAAPEDKRVAEVVEAATNWAKQVSVIESDAVAAECADFIDQLDAQYEAFDSKRKAEREPHNKALKEIQDRWLPRLERIDICRRALKPLHRAYLRLKETRRKAELAAAEREAAEAQRRADQLEEQSKAGGASAVPNAILALEATQEAAQARKAVAAIPQRAQVRGTLTGRTHSLRTVWRAAIVKQDLVYEIFRNHPDVQALLDRLANAAVRAKDGPRPDGGAKAGICAALPGCYVYESQE